jgi:hypothetical protein
MITNKHLDINKLSISEIPSDLKYMEKHGFTKYLYISCTFKGEEYVDGICLLPDDNVNKKVRQLWVRVLSLIIFETEDALNYKKTEEILTTNT